MSHSHLVACLDVDFIRDAMDAKVLTTADRRYELQGESLHHLFTEVLPELNRCGGDSRRLTHQDARLLDENLDSLMKMRIVFAVDPRLAAQMAEPSAAQRFTYVARRTERAQDLYRELEELRIVVTGHELLSRRLGELLRPWFPRTTVENDFGGESAASDSTRALLVGTRDDLSHVRLLGKRLGQARCTWTPIVYDDQEVTIGPWCDPGHSACYECAFALRNETLGEQASVRTAAHGVLAWRSTQAHSSAWIAGLLATQLDAIACPSIDLSPWGRATTISFRDFTQRSELMWRAPWCPSCGRPDVLPQRWL